MGQDEPAEGVETNQGDFFISYTGQDQLWAEWIGAELEEAGYNVFLQAWDIHPGDNLILSLDQALRTCQRCLLVLSNAYLQDGLTQAQWAAVFRQDPANEHRTLLPVKVEDCRPTGFLATHNPIDLYNLKKVEAHERLLAFIAAEQLQPGQKVSRDEQRWVAYPGSPVTWNLPYHRNPFFIGQEEYLSELRNHLWENQKAAVSGLGGIGKTQLAIEYAYRYRADYTHVFWVHAETRDTIIRSYSDIANLLLLPERQEQEQHRMIAAVKRWLQMHHRYLLILDNAETPDLLAEYLPFDPIGHLLITTRSSRLSEYGHGLASQLFLSPLTPDLGAQLLLCRALLLTKASEEDWDLARQLSVELGGLPLALDQAGAYMAINQVSLARYLERYDQHRLRLLKDRHNKRDHPESVVTTWNISFQAVEEQNAAAAELLRFCAFLAPDAIPERLLTAGADKLGDVLSPVVADALLLDEAIGVLRGYSLIERDLETGALTVHRLVQEVIREEMTEEEGMMWVAGAIMAVVEVCPDDPDFVNWPILEQLLSHALQCAIWAEVLMLRGIGAHLLNRVGNYLSSRARYEEAEPLLLHALELYEKEQGVSHPTIAGSLNNLALLYVRQGRYEEAEQLYLRVQDIDKQMEMKESTNVAIHFNNLAGIYMRQGRYEKAEPLYERVLAIYVREQREVSLDAATCLSNLALLYMDQGRYEKAEPLCEQALAIYEKEQGESHPNTAMVLDRLATLYAHLERHEEAEQLYRRALTIYENGQKKDHPDMAAILDNLAGLYTDQGKEEEAEQLHLRALTIYEKKLGSDHPDTATCLNNLAILYKGQKKYEEAEQLQLRTLDIRERKLGTNHPQTVQSLQNLAGLYIDQERYKEAEQLLKRTLAIQEQELGANHPQTAVSLIVLADVHKCQERYEEAEPLYKRALAIREQALGVSHPDTATCRHTLIELYMHQKRYEKAVSLGEQELVRCEKKQGIDHSDTAKGLTYLANLYMQQKRYEEAETLTKRALVIRERKLGDSHPDTVISLHNLAVLYIRQGRDKEAEPLLKRVLASSEQEQNLDIAESLSDLARRYESLGRYREAEPLYERALAIRERKLGADHPDTSTSLNNLAGLYTHQRRYREAEPLMRQALAISERKLGNSHPDTAISLHNLAVLYIHRRRYREAEPLLKRALAICTEALSQDDPLTMNVVKNYTSILSAMGQDSKAAKPSQDSSRSSHQREATRQKEDG